MRVWHFIVQPGEVQVYEHLKGLSEGQPGIAVILDRRRRRDRRRRKARTWWYERRSRERRQSHEIRAQQFIFVDGNGTVIWKVP